MNFDTIVALATAPMKSALHIIRVSGDDAFAIVSKIFNKNISSIDKRTALVGEIIDSDKTIDEVVLIAYKGPKSFTGEDMVEIICHGSTLIAKQIIELLIKYGARMATNGEYSSRAFAHNKIDLIQAEAINDLINSTTEEAKSISMQSLKGNTSSVLLPIKTKLADILSLIEVNIDFPEYEDIEVANKTMILDVCKELKEMISQQIDDGEKAKIIKDGINVAIVGKPNVGKSSLLNAFLKEEKAIVTSIAGTTRDVVEGDVNLDGLLLHLFDTAGIHETSETIENIGINKSIKTLENSDLILILVEANEGIDEETDRIVAKCDPAKVIIVYNKTDLYKSNLKTDGVMISAKNNDISSLIDAIKNRYELDASFNKPALNNARQIGLLKSALINVNKAIEDTINNLPVDLISVSLLNAYNNVLEIFGETNQTDFSKEIFSRFCVGK